MPTLRALLGPILASSLALVTFLALYWSPPLDPRLASPTFHFWLVSATSLLAFILSVVVSMAGIRAGDHRVAFLGAAFVGLAGFFALHGLSTPGFLIGRSRVPEVAAQLSLFSMAVWMFVAAHLRPLRDSFPAGRLLVLWLTLVVLALAVILARPDLATLLPVDRTPLRWGVSAAVVLLLLTAGSRFLESYQLSRSALHMTMLYVVGLVVVAQLIMISGTPFRLSWWLYHLLLLVAVVLLVWTTVRNLQSGRLSDDLSALLSDDAERRVAYGLRPEVRALVVATEAKDVYTGGHMQRVAGYAVRLGLSLGLGAEQLRVLAQAAVVHDVGKIELPDQVLNKPGRLSEEEFALVREHPAIGERIGKALGMHRLELQAIRHHHERWDGQGYPDRLAGEQIPILARVLAVADTYDALTSDRSYRPAWTHEQAQQLIFEEAGRAFDPHCTRTWLSMMGEPAGRASG